MTTIIGTILSALCGSIISLLLFSMAGLIQNLPSILKVMQDMVSGVIRFSATAYRLIIGFLMPYLPQHELIPIGTSILISALLCAGFTYLAFGRLIPWTFVVALLHGLAVGLNWESDFQSDDLHLGADR